MEENTQPSPETAPEPAPAPAQKSLPKINIKIAPNMFSDLVEKLVAAVKKYAPAETLSSLIERMKTLATWVITIMVAAIPLAGLIVAIRNSDKDIFLLSIGVSIALVFCQYIAKGFISSMEKLLKNASAKLATDTIPNAFGLLAIGAGIAALLVSFNAFGEAFESGLGCVLAAFALMLLGCIYMAPKMMNVEVDENNGPAQDLMGILSFLLNGIVVIFPFYYLLFGAYTFALLIKSIFAADASAAGAAFGESVAFAFATALLPLAFYLAYIFYYLIVDVIKAVLAIPRINK
ncbi:MAG: hypothetical protein IKS15_05265 [Opitutales bacterium]|nr:hypothetical protein [Opitutales bacterium]